jgi:hypothetical protein
LFVAGTGTPARSTGFGVVFSDVDHMGSASIKLLGANGNSLGVYQAPPCSGGFSFVGVQFPTSLVAAIDIRSGHGPLGAEAADVSNRDHGPARLRRTPGRTISATMQASKHDRESGPGLFAERSRETVVRVVSPIIVSGLSLGGSPPQRVDG